MGVESQDAPDRPAFAIVAQRLLGHGDGLGLVRRSRRHREHQDLGPAAEQGTDVPLPDPVDVGLEGVVAANRHATPVVGRGLDLAEVMVAAELLSAGGATRSSNRLRRTFVSPLNLLEKGLSQSGGTAAAAVDR